jgi:hypothetical protein
MIGHNRKRMSNPIGMTTGDEAKTHEFTTVFALSR